MFNATNPEPPMSSDLVPSNDGALSAVQSEAHALAAVEAMEHVQSPEQAEELLRRITAYQQAVRLAKIGHEQERRWAGIRLQAERKMGELSPAMEPAEAGAVRGTDTSGAERETLRMARKVAAIPEDAFAAYLDTADEPTRAGLLRTTATPKPDPEPVDIGPLKAKQQAKIVGGIADRARQIADLAPHLNYDAIRSIEGSERAEWEQHLRAARTVLSRVIDAL